MAATATGALEKVNGALTSAADLVWGGPQWWQDAIGIGPMALFLLGVGAYLTIGLRFMPILGIPRGFRLMLAGRKAQGEGEITPFASLMTALSATVGSGNIVGVATAITIGGPGAVFWMWVTALVGMGSKYAECMLAVNYRQLDDHGRRRGGPMYYIKNGLGSSWVWLAVLFAVGTLFSGFATGNLAQSTGVTDGITASLQAFNFVPDPARAMSAVLESGGGAAAADPAIQAAAANAYDLAAKDQARAELIISCCIALAVFAVIIGGIKSIGRFAQAVVPFMAFAYISVSLVVIFLNIGAVPEAFATIFKNAFGFDAAFGGAAGYGMALAIRYGVERGLFSNEAGQGSAPIAHAAAQSDDPVRQGTIGMLGTFIDTIVVCSMTALVIMTATGSFLTDDGQTVGHVLQSGAKGAELTAAAYSAHLPGEFGAIFIALALAVFAFTTIIGWSYYTETAGVYLFGDNAVLPIRILWCLMLIAGAFPDVEDVFQIGGLANAAMAAPNLLALLLLSPVVFSLTREAAKRGP